MTTTSSMHKIDYKDCIFHEGIGEGAFGTVNRITFQSPYNGYKEAAGKCVFNLEENEIEIMSQLHHEHIVKLIGFTRTGPMQVILMEYAPNGSLHDYLSDTTKPMPTDLKRKWATESARALQYLHGQDYLHRDIKSSNCLLFDDNLLKLCDFGLARKVEHSQTTSTQKGTYKYMAPEIVVGNEQGRAVFSKPGDLYAYGMLLLEIYTRKPPFPDWEWIKVVYEVGQNEATPTVPSDCPDRVSRIMRECWKTNPKERPTIESVLQDLLNESKEENKDVLKPVKMVLVGNSMVGKTCMLLSFMNKFPREDYVVETVVDNYSCQIYVECQDVNLGIVDTAGQVDYDRLRPLSYPTTDIFLVCFSVVSPCSYANVRDKWMPEVRQHAPGTPCLLVGTNLEMREDKETIAKLARRRERPVTKKDGERLCNKIGAVKYMECSYVTKENVKLVFEEGVRIVLTAEDEKRRNARSKSKTQCLIS